MYQEVEWKHLGMIDEFMPSLFNAWQRGFVHLACLSPSELLAKPGRLSLLH